MVSQLLSPQQPKNWGDYLVVAILGLHILTLYLLPYSLRIPVFAFIFLVWRGSYNIGIGYLLHIQSNHRRLVAWAKKLKLFVNPSTGGNPRPMLYYFIKNELEIKIPKDYDFEKAPIEFNTWLVFRRVVDLILMCDFVSYCLFAIACSGRPANESIFWGALRWIVGLGLVGFNLWVKLDAHRVVKDYAWYWGDFFYLIDQRLTFDGVFEMAPHPMYSVGYAGYYGISMMAASYNLLFISVIAHAAQFAFLVWVEQPHIDKTYNTPPPRKRKVDENHHGLHVDAQPEQLTDAPPLGTPMHPSPTHNLIGIHKVDLHRTTDITVFLLQVYVFLLTVMVPSTPLYQALFVIHAVLWRLWYSMGIGYILNRQSTKKKWTRHFLKYGESTEEAWRQWKGLYHVSMTMTYASFVAAAMKFYTFPSDWTSGYVLLNHVIGAGLLALQIWTSVSIHQSLGEFGWFYGDFFFDQASKLTYSGIYRFLNNPERVMGLAGVWGTALVTGSTSIFFLALLSHILNLSFIQLVERPHMQKLYGQKLRSESGLVKSLKRSLPPPLQKWQGNVDKIWDEAVEFIEEFLDAARPRLEAGMRTFMKDSTAVFKHPARISITRLDPDMAGYDLKEYSLEIVAPSNSTNQPIISQYGRPIKVRWTAPLNHSKLDWVGVYRVADNPSREATRIASAGRWIPTNHDEYNTEGMNTGIISSDVLVSGRTRKDGDETDYMSGEMQFIGDKLWWTTGVFEFRYHHNGKHNVMAISRPFEVRINRFDEDDVETDSNGLIRSAVETALLPVVRNCFDRDPDIAPSDVNESYGSLVERDGKYARRVVFAVAQM